MSLQRIIRKLNELRESDITVAHVRTATIVRLPFHLCTGSILHVDDPENDHLQIWLRNKFSIPYNADIREVLSIRPSADNFFTDALIVNSPSEIHPDALEAIRTGTSWAIHQMPWVNPGFQLLNELIAAHQMVRLGPYVTGIGALWPRILTNREILERILVEVVLLGDPGRIIDKSIILALFADIDRLPFDLGGSGQGDHRDYSKEQIASLELGIRKIRNHAFYELKTNAIAAALSDNIIVAIVLGCAALEGAHSAFMRLTLRDKISEQIADNDFNSFMNELLREHGFYSLVKHTVRVFMKIKERPSNDDLKRCLHGVELRNAIMHAKINKKTGKDTIREFSRSKINDGYRGIMAVYRAFEAAIESREKL